MFDYTVITDADCFDFDFDFLYAFVLVVLFGYEPEFRFIYEEGEYPQMIWIELGRFARVHGVYVDIDRYVLEDDDIFDVELDLPNEFLFEDEEEYFDANDLKDIPDEPQWHLMKWQPKTQWAFEDIFDYFDLISIPDLGAFLPEDVFNI